MKKSISGQKVLFFGLSILLIWFVFDNLLSNIVYPVLNFRSVGKYYVTHLFYGLNELVFYCLFAVIIFAKFKKQLKFLDKIPVVLINILVIILGSLLVIAGIGTIVTCIQNGFNVLLKVTGSFLGAIRLLIGAGWIVLAIIFNMNEVEINKVCKACNTLNAESSTFCIECGHSLRNNND